MIRKAGIDDIDAIRSMAQVVFRHTYKDILSSEQIEYMMDMMYSVPSLNQQLTVGRNVFFIDEGRAYASYRYDCRTDDGIEVFHIEKLYVMPQFHGMGQGKMMFDAIVSDIRTVTRGTFRIELNVNRQNSAVSFYEHIGMHKSRSGDFSIGNGYFMNDFIMSMDI